ncbi:MAG TPA: circularly permuted type 2 ATP-grasp protein, partial [Lacipirellulaceae bacterium]|nr:circularly permuted type 2 ATP-grasp protein [Lacipirellulaceae bacterium]
MSPDGSIAALSPQASSPERPVRTGLNLEQYDVGDFFDEMFEPTRRPRPYYRGLYERLWRLDGDELERRQRAAERSMRRLGITFNVYGDQEGNERIIPFDICPRIIVESQWRVLEKGLKQRVNALNKFIDDVYHKQRIV